MSVFARYAIATTMAISSALPAQADELFSDMSTDPLDFTLEQCRDEATPLITIVGAFTVPQVREQIMGDANCVATLQYRLAQNGSFKPLTVDQADYQLNIAAHVDGKFGDETLRAMTRYILSLGVADPRPEEIAQTEITDPAAEQISQELMNILPEDEQNAFVAMMAERYKDRAIELSKEKESAITAAFRYCVLHEAQASTNAPENYENMLKNWQGTFGSFVSVACMPLIQDFPEEEQEAIIEVARKALEDFIPEWKKHLNPPTDVLPDDSFKKLPAPSVDTCGTAFGPVWSTKCRTYDI